MTDRVLIEVVTTAQLGGLEQAKAGFLGMNAGVLAMAVALGFAIKVGKDALDNYAAQQTALNLLDQAYHTQGDTLDNNRQRLDAFISTNAAFISNQYDVIGAMANIVRAGNKTVDSWRILNLALDMSIAKHKDVSEEGLLLERVLKGNSKALREVGVSTADYSAIMKSHHSQAWKVNQILDLMESKYHNARGAVDHTKQSQNELTLAWQNFTTDTAPLVAKGIDDIAKSATTALGLLDLTIIALEKLQSLQATTPANGDFWDGFIAAMNGVMPVNPPAGGGGVNMGKGGHAKTGPPSKGGHGGRATPDEFGTSPIVINNHFAGYLTDPATLDRFTNEIVRALTFRPGT